MSPAASWWGKVTPEKYTLQRKGRQVTETRDWTLQFEVEPDDLDGGFVAECPQLPGAMAQGETEQEALESLADVVDGFFYRCLPPHGGVLLRTGDSFSFTITRTIS